jgi:hypothetical protein
MDFPIAELWKITCNFSEKLLAKNTYTSSYYSSILSPPRQTSPMQ